MKIDPIAQAWREVNGTEPPEAIVRESERGKRMGEGRHSQAPRPIVVPASEKIAPPRGA